MTPKDNITIQKTIADYFSTLPVTSQTLIVQAINDQVSPLLATYANQLGMSPADYTINLAINQSIQEATKSLAKSESLYSIVLTNSHTSTQDIQNLVDELVYKSYFNNQELNKSLKNAAIGLGMAAMFANPSAAQGLKVQSPSKATSYLTHSAPKTADMRTTFEPEPWGSQPEDAFLHNTMQLETSGGKNTQHKKITSGPQAGQTAIGRWALLPNTIREMHNRNKGHWGHPDLERLGSMNDTQMSKYLQLNPGIELHIARTLAKFVNKKQCGDKLKCAYSWKFGHNLSPNDIGADKLNNSYVQDYHKLQQGKSPRGLRPASFGFPLQPAKTLTPKQPFQILKSEAADFAPRLKQWIKAREDKEQDTISNTMKQYDDLRAVSAVPDSGTKPDDRLNLDLDNPMDRIKLAIRKVVGKDE